MKMIKPELGKWRNKKKPGCHALAMDRRDGQRGYQPAHRALCQVPSQPSEGDNWREKKGLISAKQKLEFRNNFPRFAAAPLGLF
jgi:hypothetical protein